MLDFTRDKFIQLLLALKEHKYHVIRHDVDLSTHDALMLAQAEVETGIRTIYYFRSIHFTSRRYLSDIQSIANMGHVVGYHYEDLTTCKGVFETAYNSFCTNLDLLRKIAPVHTACAHGSPLSRWDNQDIWNHYDIHALGINYEPMLDTDFSRTLYLTDTGRHWDGYRFSVRDKVTTYQQQWEHAGLTFHTTDDILAALSNPQHAIYHYNILLNAHPERWTPFNAKWVVRAGVRWWKNQAKRLIVYQNSKKSSRNK